MLRFFRQIRKSLMEHNKIRTYFFYAIGEIFLVVIGILLALQINNWNEHNREQRIAREYLFDITNDLASDTTQFAYMITLLEQTIDDELKVLSKTEYESEDMVFLATAILANSFRRSINHRTFNKIQNSGISTLAGFESLYDSLSNYYVETNRDLIAYTEWDIQQYYKNRVMFDEFVKNRNYELPLFTTIDSEELLTFEQKFVSETPGSNIIAEFFNTVNGRNYVTLNTQRHLYLKNKYQLYQLEASGLIDQVKRSLDTDD